MLTSAAAQMRTSTGRQLQASIFSFVEGFSLDLFYLLQILFFVLK